MEFGAQPAEAAHGCKELRTFAAGWLRPADAYGIDFLCKSPQPSGRACDFRGAALRPGAAAGCGGSGKGAADSK